MHQHKIMKILDVHVQDETHIQNNSNLNMILNTIKFYMYIKSFDLSLR